jgi:hypothetical protein
VDVTVKASPDLTGYEVAWYDVRRRDDGPGFRIVPRNAEIHIADTVEKALAPRVNRFDFEPGARWFRYFLMTRSSTDRNDYDIVLLSASTPGDLEARTEAFRKEAAGYLRSAEAKSYAALTRDFGVNPFIRVKLNGVESDLQTGATLRQAVEGTGGRGNESGVPPRLSVQKPYNGKLARVEFDHASPDILNLVLEGGEEISWQLR